MLTRLEAAIQANKVETSTKKAEELINKLNEMTLEDWDNIPQEIKENLKTKVNEDFLDAFWASMQNPQYIEQLFFSDA
jgi:hypothetical protein